MLSGNRIFGHIKTSQGHTHQLINCSKVFEDKDNWSLDYFENKEKHNQNPYEKLAIGANKNLPFHYILILLINAL